MESAQADYVCFLQNIFADGTLSRGDTPEQLIQALEQHPDFKNRFKTFLSLSREMLSGLTPIEVLSGQRARGLPPPEATSHKRILDRKIEERVIKVIYAARDYFDGTGF
jgi:hypothetical protein